MRKCMYLHHNMQLRWRACSWDSALLRPTKCYTVVTAGRWYQVYKIAEYLRVYLPNTNKMVYRMSTEAIMHIQAEYQVQRQQRLTQRKEELWTIAIDIYRSIQGEIHNVEGKIAFSTLHEHFAQLEPNFYISRARFLFCVRRIVSTEKVFQGVNSRISLFLRKMDDFFQKCDVFEQDRMNWRVFILMTYALENPKLTFKEVAEQALCLLYSDGSSVVSIMECTGLLKMSVFCDTIDPFINVEMKVTFSWQSLLCTCQGSTQGQSQQMAMYLQDLLCLKMENDIPSQDGMLWDKDVSKWQLNITYLSF